MRSVVTYIEGTIMITQQKRKGSSQQTGIRAAAVRGAKKVQDVIRRSLKPKQGKTETYSGPTGTPFDHD